MSFYTSLTGLQAATTELGVTSNNIANAGTTGFKRADASFGDIYSSTPLQKAGSIGGSGVALKGIVQQHNTGQHRVLDEYTRPRHYRRRLFQA